MPTAKEARLARIEALGLPVYTLSEEIWNSITHGLGAALSAAALVLLILKAKGAVALLSVILFGLSAILLYTNSAVYHGIKVCKAKRYLRVMDHCSIYLLIAGTYTPFAFIVLHGWLRTAITLVVWGTGILGIVLSMVDLKRFSKLEMACYLVMGWAVVMAIPTMLKTMPAMCMVLLALSGVLDTAGAGLYALGKKWKVPYIHTVYHVFVVAGSALQCLAIYRYVV
ncbi:MAG: hemolysin III family protein [Oscillospiraceae bacterium]|nr:hemolysin III family protein [Oscillospiraceae bacterium]